MKTINRCDFQMKTPTGNKIPSSSGKTGRLVIGRSLVRILLAPCWSVLEQDIEPTIVPDEQLAPCLQCMNVCVNGWIWQMLQSGLERSVDWKSAMEIQIHLLYCCQWFTFRTGKHLKRPRTGRTVFPPLDKRSLLKRQAGSRLGSLLLSFKQREVRRPDGLSASCCAAVRMTE